MKEIYIVSAKRTAVGSFNGSLSSVSAHLLGAEVIKSLLASSGLDASAIDELIMGQVLIGGKGQNPARQASLAAGLSMDTPALTINQVCGSGLRAVMLAANIIASGNAEIIIAGGQENMSLAEHSSFLRSGTKMGEVKFKDMMITDGLWDASNNYHMGITAENLAKKYNITRTEQDEFALSSQLKAFSAKNNGYFKDEIVPIKIKVKKEEIDFFDDEFIRGDSNIEALARLKPAFLPDGTVTAGNASGINDGAAAVLLASADAVKKYNLNPIARIVASKHVGVDPQYMGIGPAFATRKVLAKAGWSIQNLDLIEANEAFAAQAIAVNKELSWDPSKINVNGGAIAIGHPIGASGARVLVTLLHQMQRQSCKKGLATLCIGGGMGVALLVESF
jgi:acetyl-CoA C-acetyltransferase